MSRLSERLRRQREVKVTIGKWTFTALRPTDVEALELHQNNRTFDVLASRFVVGWQGVTEDDLIGGGVQEEVPFDLDAWQEWCANRTDFWEPIAKAILDAYTKHREVLDAVPKV